MDIFALKILVQSHQIRGLLKVKDFAGWLTEYFYSYNIFLIILCRDFFKSEYIKETLQTIVKSGNKRGRNKRVVAIMVLFVIIVGPFYGKILLRH